MLLLLIQNLIHSPNAGKLADYPFLDKFGVANVNWAMIPWNIFLALLPVALGFYLLRRYSPTHFGLLPSGKKWQLAGLLLFWLLLFPNSIYLISEARNLLGYTPEADLPYNACVRHIWRVYFIFAYSLPGWFGFACSLGQIRRLLGRLFSPVMGWGAVVFLVPLGTLGTFLGLFNRWNIWEAVTHPLFILIDGIEHLTDPVRFFNLAVISLVLYFLYLLGEIIFWGGHKMLAASSERKDHESD